MSEYGNFYRVTFNGIQDRVKKADVAQLVYDADITRYPIGTKVKKVSIAVVTFLIYVSTIPA